MCGSNFYETDVKWERSNYSTNTKCVHKLGFSDAFNPIPTTVNGPKFFLWLRPWYQFLGIVKNKKVEIRYCGNNLD